MVDFNAFAVRVGTECKALRTLVNGNAADLNGLTTANKTSLVAAINEIVGTASSAAGINDATTSSTSTWSSAKIATFTGGGGGAGIDDASTSTLSTWSSSKTSSSISAVVGGAPTALNTLGKVSIALGADPAYATTTTTALSNRVRVDSAQSFNGTQQAQARANIGAAWSTDMGDPTTDFVSIFQAALV
jgi:hypothetical protein